jgi:hypothetical protein
LSIISDIFWTVFDVVGLFPSLLPSFLTSHRDLYPNIILSFLSSPCPSSLLFIISPFLLNYDKKRT